MLMRDWYHHLIRFRQSIKITTIPLPNIIDRLAG